MGTWKLKEGESIQDIARVVSDEDEEEPDESGEAAEPEEAAGTEEE